MRAEPTPDATHRRGRVALGLALAVAVLLPVLPLLTGSGLLVQHDIWISDLLHSQLPYKAFLGRQLAAGHFPLWMPDVFSGVPFLAQIEAGGLFLPHWPLFALFDPYRALGLALALDIVVGGLGAWALARRMGLPAHAALLAGVSFAWCGFLVTHGRHLNMHAAGALLPWILLALERLLATAGRRGGPLLALLLALQLAAGHPQITWITGLVLGARWLAELPVLDNRGRLRSLLALGLAVGLGTALMAVQLVPVLAFTRSSLATTAPTWEYAAAFPFALSDLWALVWPPAAGAMETFDHPGGDTVPWGNYGYAGLLPLLLAPLGALAAPLPRRLRLLWALLALGGLLIALGPHTPAWHAVWSVVPGAKLFRFPTRFLVVLDLGLALLGAAGLAALLARLRPRLGRGRPRALPLLAVLLAGLTLAELSVHQGARFPIDDVEPWRNARSVADRLDDDRRAARTWTAGELGPWEAAFLEARGFRDGTAPYRSAWQLPLGSSGVMSGLHSASGYARMVHVRTALFWQSYNRGLLPDRFDLHQPGPDQPALPDALGALLDRAAVRTVVAPWPLEAPDLVPLPPAPGDDADGVHVYDNTDALPRAALVTRWQPVDDLRGAADWMFRDGRDQPAVPAVEGAPPPPDGTPAQLLPITLTERGTDRLDLDLPADAPAGLVLVADSWDEGWQAQIDGVPTPVLVANGYQRAVQVPAGARRVQLRYRPPGLATGLAVSGLAALLWVVWAGVPLVSARRARRTT